MVATITVTIWVRPVPSLCPNIVPEQPHKTVANTYRWDKLPVWKHQRSHIYSQVSHSQVQQLELKSMISQHDQGVLFYMQEAGSGLGLLDGWDVREVGLNTSRERRCSQARVNCWTICLHCSSVCNVRVDMLWMRFQYGRSVCSPIFYFLMNLCEEIELGRWGHGSNPRFCQRLRITHCMYKGRNQKENMGLFMIFFLTYGSGSPQS